MPFIIVKIDNHKIIAVIDTSSPRSFISLEAANKCDLLSLIDRNNIINIKGTGPPITVYGRIYNQKIIINNAIISRLSNTVNK